jgi:hypothetical protein
MKSVGVLLRAHPATHRILALGGRVGARAGAV